MSLYVEITGQGPDLVLLHGWAMHGGVFAELISKLSAHYRVHCIDLPGHGRSNFTTSIGDLEQLTAAVQPSVPVNAIVLGWSLGGLIALKLAQRQALHSLVLVSATPRFVASEDWLQGMSSAVFAQFFSRLQQNLNGTVEDFLRLQVRGDSQAATTFTSLQASLLQHPADPVALQVGLEILRDADARASLPTLNVPTLVVAGEYDRITHPDACRYLVDHLPQARHCLIKRAGHAAFISHREQFLSELHDFLSDIGAMRQVATSG